jgi:transcriptional regulator of PTS gene
MKCQKIIKTTLTTRSFQKALHRSNILELIRTTELISRTDLARATGLSQASITGITADFIREGLIEEKQSGAYEGGRRPILLAVRPDGVHVIGINMAIHEIRVVIVNFQAEVKASHTAVLANDYYSPKEIVSITAQAIQACMWEANFSKDQISGAGVGIPGPVDSAAGVIRFLPNYGWKDVPFQKMLQEKINHPVFIDNSSNNLATGEYWYGNGRGVANFLVITLENGVGAGMMLNGQLIRGHLGIASEFGHICAELNGPPCRCGRNGCIEAFVGNNSILRDAKKLAGQGKWSRGKVKPDDIHFNEVIDELARGSNVELESIYRKAGEILGVGIYNMITMLDPERVIITGKGVAAGDKLFNPMFIQIERLKSDQFGFPDTEIVIQKWTDGDWARESGTLVLREIYKSPFFK